VCTEANSVKGAEAAISSFTVGIWMSLWMKELDTYQGASTISRKTMDWKRSKISMFEFDVLPQSWMPYVQMGLNIAL
jgi:hypothetical protein